MSWDLVRPDGSVMRQADLATVLAWMRDGACCAIVAVSNMGKSALLRLLAEPSMLPPDLADAAAGHTLVLVNCNHMLELSEQGFYELILRSLLEQASSERAVQAGLQEAYEQLIHPASPFDIPLGFNRGMTAISRQPGQRLVMLFDEFDQALIGIQGRVFLNLRALRDQFAQQLAFVIATAQPLREMCDGHAVSEFCELFTHHTHYLPPLSREDIEAFVARFAEVEGVTFDEADHGFIYEWAGGHPGLLEATCRALGRITGAVQRDATQDWLIHREVASWLPDELAVRVECRKIWEDLSGLEQETLFAVVAAGETPQELGLASLARKHILQGPADEPRFFSRLFADYVQRMHTTYRPARLGIRVDVESGTVHVDGRETDPLTNLEFRLLLLLYGRRGTIVSKDQVVEAVWGDEYMEDVDDARIEKLLSRLRSKVEPDPKSPRFVTTVRGRGYRLEG